MVGINIDYDEIRKHISHIHCIKKIKQCPFVDIAYLIYCFRFTDDKITYCFRIKLEYRYNKLNPSNFFCPKKTKTINLYICRLPINRERKSRRLHAWEYINHGLNDFDSFKRRTFLKYGNFAYDEKLNLVLYIFECWYRTIFNEIHIKQTTAKLFGL